MILHTCITSKGCDAHIVKTCKCGGETGDAACYACLQNYQNQFYHDDLRRKYAIEFFEQLGFSL